MKSVVLFLFLSCFSQVGSALVTQKLNLDHHQVKLCDYSVACRLVYPDDSFDHLICIGEGRDIIYGPEPRKIIDYVKKICSQLSDPNSVLECIVNTGCVQPYVPTTRPGLDPF